MDDLYTLHSSMVSYPGDTANLVGDGSERHPHHHHQQLVLAAGFEVGMEMMSDVIKAQIANHPLYPNLLSAYIDCRKVGAPPEMATLLEEISQETHPVSTSSTSMGTDPELDEFMKSYCEVLMKYKEELSKPLDEATNFLSSIQSQLTHLCKQTLPSPTLSFHSTDDGGGGQLEDDVVWGEVEAGGSQESSVGTDRDLKQMLMRKYSGYLSSLRKEFLKKRKKGKLPKDARIALLEWWNAHYRWPYPTEEEKQRLSEMTGLDQKQINNWFINQRKRHWRPSEDMRFALMDGVSGSGGVINTSTTSCSAPPPPCGGGGAT